MKKWFKLDFFLVLSFSIKSGGSKSAGVSGNLALDGSGNGLSFLGNADESFGAKAGLQSGEKKQNQKTLQM